MGYTCVPLVNKRWHYHSVSETWRQSWRCMLTGYSPERKRLLTFYRSFEKHAVHYCWIFMGLSGLTSSVEAWFHGTDCRQLVGTQMCLLEWVILNWLIFKSYGLSLIDWLAKIRSLKWIVQWLNKPHLGYLTPWVQTKQSFPGKEGTFFSFWNFSR